VRQSTEPRITFLAFFLLWAERMGWDVPPLHVRACEWLGYWWKSAEPDGLFMLPRGHAKSTILGIFNAWVYFEAPQVRILHQGESDQTAYKTSRDTKAILRKHPLTAAMGAATRGEISFWWLPGNDDERNPSMQAAGILSNVTSSRADFIQNDDVEVQKNIRTPEARESLRHRLAEQIHIAVPGAKTLWVGTPHTHDSLYDDVRKRGAMAMIVPMFSKAFRIDRSDRARYEVGFRPEYVFAGIGEGARMLREGHDYRIEGDALILASPGGELLDCYADAAWPERFDRAEMEARRKKCPTINEWDSQYQLQSKPITQVRLDPARIIPYNVEPELRRANGGASMWLGNVHIVGAACRWDPSGGKINSDVSAASVVLQDDSGRRYLQAVEALTGEVAEFADDGKTIIGGQVWQLCGLVERYNIPRVSVETNGIGGFAPTVLRAALRQRKLRCAVVDITSTANKNKRILETLEPLLLSRGMLWGHVDVLRGPLWAQMRDWNPAVTSQPDDLIDAVSGAVSEQPERFRVRESSDFGIPNGGGSHDWRPEAGTFDVEFER